jgi:HEAT repeat protein
MDEAEKTKSRGKTRHRLVTALRESDDFTRAKVVEQIVSSPSRSLIEQVVTLLDEKNTSLRMDVLDILKKTGNCCIEAIIQLLYHENEDVRVYGCEVLSSLRAPVSLPYLIERIYDNDENVKNAAVMALGEFDDERAVDVLLEVLEQEEWVAFSAIYSLAKIGNKKAISTLLDVFKSREEELSLAACEVLISFRESETIEEIIDYVGHLKKEKRSVFLRVIIEQGDEEVFRRLVKRVGHGLLQHLLSFLEHEKKRSLEIARFLVHFKHKDSARAMLNILKDLDPDGDDYESILALFMELEPAWAHDLEEYLGVEEYVIPVIRACAGLGRSIDERLLLKAFCSSPLDTKREIMKQLGRVSPGDGYEVIREAMKDSDGHVQADAVAIAGNLALRELTPDILHMAKDGFPDVRMKALLALVRLDLPMALAAIDWFVKEGTSEDKRVYLSVTTHLSPSANYPFLKELIGDSDERIRQSAIRVIGNLIDHEEYLDLFRAVLTGGNVPNEVLKVIGEKKLTAFKQLLLDIVLDPLQMHWTKYYALVALGALADRSLLPVFLGALKEKDNLTKIGALKALSELRDKRAVPQVRPYTKSADQDLKTAAQVTLERLSHGEEAC